MAAARLPASVVVAGERGVRAVGGDEVDQQFRVLDVLREVDPARVGLELAVAGHLVELAACRVQRRNAGVAAAREVDGGEVERQAEQVVAQRLGLELVDLVADLAGGAAHDGAGRLLGGERAALSNASGLRKASIRPISLEAKSGSRPVDRLQQHRVAEAVDRVRELGHDRRIDGGVEAVGGEEHVDVAAGSCARTPRTPGAGTASRCRTWPPGTGARRPTRSGRQVGGNCRDGGQQPLVQERTRRRSTPSLGSHPWCGRPGGCARRGRRGGRR